MSALKKTFDIPWWPILFGCMVIFCLTTSVIGNDLGTAENYCLRCHESHPGLDYEIDTCMSCHEAVPMGYMELYPWYSSEAAIAGIRCNDCHKDEHLGDSCLSCHPRHSDPLR